MLKKEQILKVLKKYGFYSLNRAPYLYQNKEELGVYFIWPNKHYGNLERVIYFYEEESLEEEVFKYWWYTNNKEEVSLEVEFDNYEILNPKVLYKYNGIVLTANMMKDFPSYKNNLLNAKESCKKKQLLRTANILILILKEKFKLQNNAYFKVEKLGEELQKITNEYRKKLNAYQKNEEEIPEAYELFMDDYDESEKLLNALYDELASLDTIEEIRTFINSLYDYLYNLETNEAHLQNIYLLNRYPFEIEDIKKKIAILDEVLKIKKQLFKPKADVMQAILEVDNNSPCKKMVNINVYIEKEKKRIASKYENKENIEESLLGDYLVDLEKLSIEVPEMIEEDGIGDILNKEELLVQLNTMYDKLSKKEKSACFVASSFLKECLNILIEKDVVDELNVNEIISRLIVDKQIEPFNEAFTMLDNYINAKIRVKYFSVLKINTFESFMASLIESIRILKHLSLSLENAFYGYYMDKSKEIITLYLKNIFNYNNKTSYITTILPNVPIYYSPVSVIKQLDIVENPELMERKTDTIFLLKEKISSKTKKENVIVVKYEKDKVVKRKEYIVITSMKEKNRCNYNKDMMYNKEDGGIL